MKKTISLIIRFYLIFIALFFLSFSGIAVAQETETEENFEVVETEKEDIEVNENKDDESELNEKSDKEKETDEISKKNKSSVLSAKSVLTASADEEETPEVKIDKKVVPHTNLSSGTASYGVSIEVPPGRNGLTPEVSLSYNSGSSNGFLGIGWALSYGGEIKRSTKRGLNYSDNKFEINGNELISISGSANNFREKIESGFSKYYYNTANKSWTVTLRDGTKYYYGSETQSRQEKSGSEIFKWCLDKVVDTNGNYIQILYYKDQNQIYPEEIKYTGNLNSGVRPQNSIKFVQDTVSRPDSFSSYKLKTNVVTAKRLKSVKVYGNGEFVRRYNLTYDTAPHTGRSRITKIEEFGDDDASSLPEKNFVWENGNNGRFSQSYSYISDDPATDNIFKMNKAVSFMDVNGDGYSDRVITESATGMINRISVTTNISRGNGSFTGIIPSGGSQFKNNYYGISGIVNFGDINGDGLPDLIVICTKSEGVYKACKTYTFLNTGGGTFSSNYSYVSDDPIFSNSISYNNKAISFMDINGDGYADRVITEVQKITGFDVNKIYVTSNLSCGDGTFIGQIPRSYSQYANSYVLHGKHNFGDINGDGLTDLVINCTKTKDGYIGGKTYTFLNTADGKFSSNYSYISDDPVSNDISYKNTISFLDINGDGYADRVTTALQNFPMIGVKSCVTVNISNGDGTFNGQIPKGSFPNYEINYNLPGIINFGDINGDGQSDLIVICNEDRTDYINGQSVRYRRGKTYTFLNQNNYKQDLLTKVKLGPTINSTQKGATIDIAYKIPPRSTKMFPFFNPVVDTLTINDGIKSASSVTKYDYLNGYYKGTERESRGFEKVTQTNPDGTILDTWYYQEDDYLKGQAIKTEFKKPDGSILSTEVPTWGIPVSLSGGGKFIKIDSKKSSVTNGNTKVETKEEYTYNLTNGFVETVTSSVLPDGTGDEITSEKVYENTGDCLWRLSEEILYKKNSKTEVLSKTTYSNFDSRGNHRLETYYNNRGDDSTKSITYDPDYGFVTDEYDSDNKLIYHADYDSTSTYVKSIRNILGHTTTYEYNDKFGQISQKTDANGNISRYLYDTFGRVVTVYNDGKPGSSDYKDGSGITYEYQDDVFPQCVVTKIHSTDDNKIDQYDYYDGLNRKIQTSGAGEFVNDTSARRYIISRFHYDNMGRSWLAEGPFFSVTNTPDYSSHDPKTYPIDAYPWTETVFDYLGQPLSQSSRTSDEFITTSYSYDGLEKTVTDPDGKSIKQITNYLGKIIQVVEAPDDLNYNTYYTYNAAGEVVNIRDNEN
ncbi:MAG: hypothetical protein GY714_02800, partial [Desulfobacterales bacterium]|nr:hypothetical protein [Desulfobacterales bacterium]